jgi:hypothetical protein
MHYSIFPTLFLCLCSIASSQVVGVISFCQDFGGPDAPGQRGCKDISFNNGPFTAGFEFDKADLNRQVGGSPSSAKIITPGVICGIGTKIVFDIQGFFNFVPHCEGERMLLDGET